MKFHLHNFDVLLSNTTDYTTKLGGKILQSNKKTNRLGIKGGVTRMEVNYRSSNLISWLTVPEIKIAILM